MKPVTRAVGAVVVALALVGAAPALAQNAVANPSFESPVLAPGGMTLNSIPGWTASLGPNGTDTHGISYNRAELMTPFGNQWAYVDGNNEMSQTTTKVIEASQTYTLTAYFGLRTDQPPAPFGQGPGVELWAGGTSVAGGLPGGTFITGEGATTVQGAFVSKTIVWTPPPGSPLIGQTLSVRMTSGAGGQTAFDNVSLTTPSPVPTLSEWAMILFGLLLAGGAAATLQRRRIA